MDSIPRFVKTLGGGDRYIDEEVIFAGIPGKFKGLVTAVIVL